MQNFQKGLVYPTFYPSFYPTVLFISKHCDMMTLENYDYEYLIGLSPRELSNFYKAGLSSNREINNIFKKFIDDFINNECPPGDSLFLMGSNVQAPPNTTFIEVRQYQGDYIWRQVICNNESVSLRDWHRMSTDELKRALFFGMTRCSGDIYSPIKELRRCTQSEAAKGDMLDYVWEADEREDKTFYLNNDSQESVNENKQKKARNKYMKLTQRDIQYIMNEARNIVAEKRGMVKENVAIDSIKAATKSEAEVGKNNATGSTLGRFATKVIRKADNAVQKLKNKKQDKSNNETANVNKPASSTYSVARKKTVLAKP